MILEEPTIRAQFRQLPNGSFAIQYGCPLTGTMKRVPLKRTRLLKSRMAAQKWAEKNMGAFIEERAERFKHQRWRLNLKLLRRVNEYEAWRREEFPRSAKYEMSVLWNYVLPFFIDELNKKDPNTWCDYEGVFYNWLRNKARTRAGGRLAYATINRAISVANQFLSWCKKSGHVRAANFHKFELVPSRKLVSRGLEELVDDHVFNEVHRYLKAQDRLYADMWYTQRKMGFRITEMLGISFRWLSNSCHDFIADEFRAKGLTVYGAVYLESQPSKAYLTRNSDGSIERAPLKGREGVGLPYSRTVPILDSTLWKLLKRRADQQLKNWKDRIHGGDEASYLIFDGAKPAVYRRLIQDAYASMGLKSNGTHILRHTLSTEWAELKISNEVAELALGHQASSHARYVHIVALVNASGAKGLSSLKLMKNVEKKIRFG